MYRYTIALTLLMAWGCQQNSESSKPSEVHDLEHSGEGSQYTLFSGNTEFFIEHGFPEEGEEFEFLVHVTRLDTYKPYTSGSLTLEIDGVSVTSDKPERPGIFNVPFIPRKAGSFDLKVSLYSGESAESVSGQIHVADHQSDDADAGEGHLHEALPAGDITFLKEQAWNSNFMVSEVKTGTLSSVILTSGEVIAAPGKINRVEANIGGIVYFANRNLVQGQHVEKGSLLFTISGRSLPQNNFELQYQQASNSLEKSRSEYARHQKLHARGVISERQFLESRATYLSDSLGFFALAESTSENGLQVFAPSSGTIHELNVSEGEYIETGHHIATLSSDQVLLLRADLPQQFQPVARQIYDANFRLTYSQETFSISDFGGRHLATGKSAAENDHYLPVYFELQNDGRLIEGAFAEIYLKTLPELEKMLIPLGAVSEEQGIGYVYVQVTGESYSKRAVETGKSDGKMIEITSGLAKGERIVTRGPMLIKSASMVTGAGGDGHAH